jgi:uncharacterized membrane protein YeiH
MSPAAILDLIAVFIFALTGGLVASRAQLDIVGFLFLSCLTGVGGGTLRNPILGRDPVFWVGSPHYLGVACFAAILAVFPPTRLESRYQAIVWLDALALSVAAVAGVSIAREAGASWPIVLIMGVATVTVGGLMRDVVTNEIPLVLRKGDLYVEFIGPILLGTLARVTDDPSARAAALAELDALLEANKLGHNHLLGRRDAIEACLDAKDWDGAEHHALALESFFRPEELTWSTFFARRGQTLARLLQHGADKTTMLTLADLAAQARAYGYLVALPGLERAMTVLAK